MRAKLTACCCLFLLVIVGGPALPQAPARPVAAASALAQSPQRAHAVLKDVLSRREFAQYRPRTATGKRPTTPGWFKNLTKAFKAWLRKLWKPIQQFLNWLQHLAARLAPKNGGGSSHATAIMLLVLRYLIYAIVAAAVLFALGLLVKSLILRQRIRAVDDHPDAATTKTRADRRRPPEPSGWERSLHDAEAFWAQGNEREALRVLYRACLVLLDARGVLRYDESRANGEVLRELRRQGHGGVQQALTPIVRVFDRSWYGFLHVSGDEFSTAMQQIRAFRDTVIGGLHG